MERVSAYFLTTDKAIVTKLDPTMKEIELYKNLEFGDKGGVTGSHDQLLKFLDPSISRERLKLETLNLACRLATRGHKQKMQIRSKGVT